MQPIKRTKTDALLSIRGAPIVLGPGRVGAQSGLGPGPGWGPYGPIWTLMGPYMGPYGRLWVLLDRSWKIT